MTNLNAERLDIAFFGSSLVSAYWNGAATYYRGIIEALSRLGHRITFYEPDAFDRQKHRDLAQVPYARSVVFPADETHVYESLERAAHSDIVVKASGVGVFDELLEREVLALKSDRTQVCFWDVDAPATLYRVATNPEDPFAELVPQYDLILTYGGGDPVVRAYRSLGARDCVPIYNALDPASHFPVDPEPRFEADLAFLGNRMPDREQRVHEFLFKPASLLPNKQFLLAGSGWANDVPHLANIRTAGHVYTSQHNAFNCSPLAVLNISRESMARNGFSPATRVFEAAGAGACLITDEWEGIERFLEPGAECLVAADGEAVRDHLLELTPARAREIGQAARQRVLAEHTYDQRARQLQAVFQETQKMVRT